jgi:hypothetical protein
MEATTLEILTALAGALAAANGAALVEFMTTLGKNHN